jgi:small subunit ribosomal protein S20
MPVTKTAKRALRSSKKKEAVNKKIRASLEVAIRLARKEKSKKTIQEAISTVDRAAKKKVLHRKKAARIKSSLSKLLPKSKKQKA